jgi:hypothetical protein
MKKKAQIFYYINNTVDTDLDIGGEILLVFCSSLLKSRGVKATVGSTPSLSTEQINICQII